MAEITKSAGDFWVSMGYPFLTNMGGRPIPTDAQLMLEYLTNDLVYTCANWNAASTARVRFRLYAQRGPGQKAVTTHPIRPIDMSELRRLKGNPNLAARLGRADGVEEITDHPLIDLLERDNDGLCGYQLRYMTGVYMEVFGGAYWFLEPGMFEPVHNIKSVADATRCAAAQPGPWRGGLSIYARAQGQLDGVVKKQSVGFSVPCR